MAGGGDLIGKRSFSGSIPPWGVGGKESCEGGKSAVELILKSVKSFGEAHEFMKILEVWVCLLMTFQSPSQHTVGERS